MNRLQGLLALVGATIASTAAAVTGEDVVVAVDANANQFEDQVIEYEAITVDGDKEPRSMRFSVTLKGEKRLVDFSAPGDLKGTRVLVLKRSQMYIYLPAYNKVRRVASHVTGQGFMGTTFSDEDMSTSLYGPFYDSELIGETSDVWSVELTPKPTTETPYGSLKIVVAKEGNRVQSIEYFGKEGQHLKTETRSDYRCEEEVCSPQSIEMVDHTRGNVSSTLKMKDFAVNQGIEDDVFSVRNLSRGD